MELQLTTLSSRDLQPAERQAIITVCTEAYEEDFAPVLALFPDATHVLARVEGQLVSHACWVTRWLQPEGLPLLHTAYVEAVATLPTYQEKGIGSTIMQRVAAEIQGYALGGLCAAPAHAGFYERLGWEMWHGPKGIRTSDTVTATPDVEAVMILRTPRTPLLDLHAPLTAEWREGDVW